MANNLFDTFKPVSLDEWKQIIQADLKGADYNETLVWESLEGIKVKPTYHSEDTEYLELPKKTNIFGKGELINIEDETTANEIAKDAVHNGIEVIIFSTDRSCDLDVLLQDLPLNKDNFQLIFNLDMLSTGFIDAITSIKAANKVKIWVDPISHLLKKGSWISDEAQDLQTTLDLVKKYSGVNIAVKSCIFQNSGANVVQQMAYTLSYIMEYLNIDSDKVITKIPVFFAIGGNYFFEISKIRAFRYLWNQIAKSIDCKAELEIYAIPSRRNKSLKDYHNNILRTSTELMSAVIGGADVCCGLAYDVLFSEYNIQSARNARNQLNLIKEEVVISDVDQITQGTYYIESLSIELAKKALDLFKTIEDADGLLAQFTKGKIQEKIKHAAEKEQALYNEGKIVLVGSNKYEQADEKAQEPLTTKCCCGNKTDFEPLVKRYLAF